MGILDFILVIFLLLFVLEGVMHGFGRSLISLFNGFICFILALVLAKPFAWVLEKLFSMTSGLTTLFTKKLGGLSVYFRTALENNTPAAEALGRQAGLGSFMSKLLGNFKGGTIKAGATPAQYFGSFVGSLVSILLAAIILYFLLRLVLFIAGQIVKSPKRKKLIKAPSRIGGAAIGLFKGIFIAGILVLAVSFLKYIPFTKKAQKAVHTQMEKTVLIKPTAKIVEATWNFTIKNINLKKLTKGLVRNVYEAPKT